ncbi:helix-turn-helix transcriptional regulator [Vibrio breoganii]
MTHKNLNLLNASEVAKILGMSVTTFWRLRKANNFLKPIVIKGRKGWPMYKVEEWIEIEFDKAQK